VLPHRELRNQWHNDEAYHLCQRRDRGGKSTPGDKPIVQGAVDAELERSRPIHPGDAKQEVEDDQRQQDHGGACDEHCKAQRDA
jgi:hypothetical protein